MEGRLKFKEFFEWWIFTVKGRNLTADEWITITKKYDNENKT